MQPRSGGGTDRVIHRATTRRSLSVRGSWDQSRLDLIGQGHRARAGHLEQVGRNPVPLSVGHPVVVGEGTGADEIQLLPGDGPDP